jgi:hypothetical protein
MQFGVLQNALHLISLPVLGQAQTVEKNTHEINSTDLKRGIADAMARLSVLSFCLCCCSLSDLDGRFEVALDHEGSYASMQGFVCRHFEEAEHVQRESHFDAGDTTGSGTDTQQIQTT